MLRKKPAYSMPRQQGPDDHERRRNHLCKAHALEKGETIGKGHLFERNNW